VTCTVGVIAAPAAASVGCTVNANLVATGGVVGSLPPQPRLKPMIAAPIEFRQSMGFVSHASALVGHIDKDAD